MSCGNPHATDCREVLDEVFFYLDNETQFGHLDVEAVRVHLEECRPCLAEYGLEQAVISLVSRCCGRESAPDRLREQVLVRLQTVRADLTATREAGL